MVTVSAGHIELMHRIRYTHGNLEAFRLLDRQKESRNTDSH
jgi:hypothetical protein